MNWHLHVDIERHFFLEILSHRLRDYYRNNEHFRININILSSDVVFTILVRLVNE